MRTVHIPWRVLAGLLAVVVTGGCETIEGLTSGSKGVALPQNSATNAVIDKLGDAACGLALATAKSKVSQNPGATEPVQEVANRLIEAAKRSPQTGDAAKKINWRVTVIDDQKVENAYGCPGGKILVYTGVFRIAKDQAGLAAILGHEMTHALDRHTSPPLNVTTLASAGAITAGIAGATSVNDLSPEAKGVVAALGLGALVGISQGFSREQETEADRGGLLLAAQAGYKPSEYSKLLKRFTDDKCVVPSHLPAFLSAHPDPAERLKEIDGSAALQAQAKELYEKSPEAGTVGTVQLPGDHCA